MPRDECLPQFYEQGGDNRKEYADPQGLVAPPRNRGQESENEKRPVAAGRFSILASRRARSTIASCPRDAIGKNVAG